MKNILNTQIRGISCSVVLLTLWSAGSPAWAVDYYHLDTSVARSVLMEQSDYSIGDDNTNAAAAGTINSFDDHLYFYNSAVTGPVNREFVLGSRGRNIGSMTFGANSGTTQIDRDAATNGTGNNTVLQIGAGGITMDAGAGAVSFGSSVADRNQRVTVGAFADMSIVNNSSSDLRFNRVFDGRTFGVTNVITVAGSGDGDTIFVEGIRDNASGRGLAMTINKTSGTGVVRFEGSNNYTGATIVDAGSLIINGSTGAESVLSVAVGANLGGSGTVGGAATIGGNLMPGNSAGLLTFSSSLTLESAASTTMEINGSGTRGTDFDGINVGTQLTYGGNLTLDFGNTFELGTYALNLFDFGSQTGSFDSMELSGNYTGALSNSLGVWTLSQANTFGGNNTWTFSESTGDLGLNVVPEPTTWMLLVGSLAALAVFRRRRRS